MYRYQYKILPPPIYIFLDVKLSATNTHFHLFQGFTAELTVALSVGGMRNSCPRQIFRCFLENRTILLSMHLQDKCNEIN